ncbi:MAG: 3-oxoacyl-[acyl-carrier-protein] reductase [Eubacteriales bacterium]|nr:3-oxoacyl-[acyl-carrier-protein] reductase [Eubacteriales bacterium]
MNHNSKTALITGGTRGIGRAIALALAGQVENIALLYAGRRDAAEDTVNALLGKGVKSLAFACDVADSAQAKAACDQAREAFGPISILVNSAGITRDGLTLRMPPEDFKRVIEVNLAGAFHTIQACYRDLMKAGWGRVVNIGSVSGLMGNPGQMNYSAAKAGLVGLTKTLARELAGRGVTANLVAPGFIDTDMTRELPDGTLARALAQVPMGRMGKAEEVAAAVNYLCSPGADYVTGCVLQVDGGMYM